MLLRFWWSQPFGSPDPIYGHDIGFYLFELPLLELMQNSVLTAGLLMTSVLIWLGYLASGDLTTDWRRLVNAPAPVLWHALANPAVYLLALAWGFYLDRYELLLSTRGIVHGMGYSDFNAVLPAIWIIIFVTFGFAAALVLAPLHKRQTIMLTALFRLSGRTL